MTVACGQRIPGYAVRNTLNGSKNPSFLNINSQERGGNAYRTWQTAFSNSLLDYFNILRTWENLASSAKPSQSLVIPELQLSEVLDGANHLRGVAVLVGGRFLLLLRA